MRTIKFKAKTLKADEWIVGDLVCSNGKIFIKHEDEPNKVFPLCTKVDPDTVCQFTGLTDKNGKEIYEGDVLRSDDYPFSCIVDNEFDNYYGIIGWSDEVASLCVVATKKRKYSVRGISDGICNYISQTKMKRFEVIGNIHDLKYKKYDKCFQEAYKEQQP